MARRKRKSSGVEYQDIELNIMPFIDVFSILNIFLLVSASFLSIGVIKVQVPFFTNAPVPPEKAKRSLSINVDIEKTKIELKTSYSQPPINEKIKKFDNNEAGLKDLHTELVSIRNQNPDTDLVTVFSEDDVTYEEITKLLDAIKIRLPSDPAFANKADEDDSEVEKMKLEGMLYPKVVMGSVIL